MTGIQIHNWGEKFDDESPNLEFVAPTSVYVVVSRQMTALPDVPRDALRLLPSTRIPAAASQYSAQVIILLCMPTALTA